MKAHTFAAIALAALPLVGVSSATEATAEPRQGRQEQERDHMRFRGMDANGDGRITRAEWRGNDRSFRNNDWNNDGVLSGDEVRVGAGRNRAGDMQADEYYDWTPAGFRDLDRNRDGRISRAEWNHDPQTFARADRNRDNLLSRPEFLGYDANEDVASDDRFDDRFEELDTNGNGRIERREWAGTRAAFDALDRNNDGWLSRAETVSSDVDTGETAFANLDTDRNGTIERDEWRGPILAFERRDRNGDGRLTRAEAGELAATGTSGQFAGDGRDLVVSAQVRWSDTGLTLRSGDRLQLSAEGTISLSGNDGGNDTAGPAGAFSGRRANNAPIPSAAAGALIARIGDGQPFVVGGRQWNERVGQSGRLYLGINDDHLGDNRGEFRVRIAIDR
jgi:Ca2+-binding EF-hand superfamily protein